jgi:hypothetical protein
MEAHFSGGHSPEFRVNLHNDALIVLVDLVQPGARCFDNLNFSLRSQAHNLGEFAFDLHIVGEFDLENFPALGAQGFIDGIAGIDEFFHGVLILPVKKTSEIPEISEVG